jgi:hypothetical protein
MNRNSKTTDDTVPLGWYTGDQYFLNIASDMENPDEWCVSINRNTQSGKPNKNITRIDTNHGSVHIDKLWMRSGDGRKEYFDDDYSKRDAIDHLKNNWEEYAYRYARFREDRDVKEPS